jgi:hypothetical protein
MQLSALRCALAPQIRRHSRALRQVGAGGQLSVPLQRRSLSTVDP